MTTYLDDNGNEYEDLYALYDDDYEPDPWCEGYDDEEATAYTYLHEYYAGPLSLRQRIQSIVWRIQYRIKQRLDYVRRWLKWHNHKCTVCGKPATADGEVCPSCDIPF